MKRFVLAIVALTGCSAVWADTWVEGTISELRIVANGNSNDGVQVLGTFNPATGCTTSGFMLFATDPYFAQSYAALLAAHMSGAPIRYLHSFCLANGYSRGNSYSVLR